MPVIRSDGHVSDGWGAHDERHFSYVSIEAAFAAMDRLRELSAQFGYYYRRHNGRETYNLGDQRGGGSPRATVSRGRAPSGVVLPYELVTGDEPNAASRARMRYGVVTGSVGGRRVPLRYANCSVLVHRG